MNGQLTTSDSNLPSLPEKVLPGLEALTQALGIPRDALPSDDDIRHAWHALPRELKGLSLNLSAYHELIVRMCVAVSTGLFDGAMNYAWNATILQLREKVKKFGLAIVAQINQEDFEEKNLLELSDNRLLELCLKINLIDEGGFFFLDQCRNTRNNFSAAHPTIGSVNDREFITFLNRCVTYALADSSSPCGVNISEFISSIKGKRFVENQLSFWIERLKETHDAQRRALTGMIYGVYCDPNSSEPSRLNALDMSMALKDSFNAATRADLINRHNDYRARGDDQRYKASSQFFERIGSIQLLNKSDQHNIFYKASERLWNVHNSIDNFYNEPPFAERLLELSSQGAVPEATREYYVQTVVCCYIGNTYGVSRAAEPSYDKMIRAFSPGEVATMVRLAQDEKNILGWRVVNANKCRERFVQALKMIDSSSVSDAIRTAYHGFTLSIG